MVSATVERERTQQVVQPVPHTLVISSGPTALPATVASTGQVALSASATDSRIHALTYTWAASCPAIGAEGTFAPSATAQNPTWTAPRNLTASQQACAVSVTVTDGTGESVSGSVNVNVAPLPHALTIDAGPTVIPNPVNSSGPAVLAVTATDSHDHGITYSWTASCPTLGTAGSSFSPSAAAEDPTWVAPANATGLTHACALTVVASDGLGKSATATVNLNVSSVGDTVTISAGPTAAPETVASAGALALTVTATDSIVGHVVGYSWSAVCAGGLGAGTFAPDASAQNPTWNAPVNATGAARACTLTVSASDGLGQTDTKAVVAQVQSIADVVSITAGPTAAPDTVASAGAVTLAVSATDSIIGHTVSYTWSAVCAGGLGAGTFAPSASAQNPTWTAPVNATGAARACTLTVVASDGLGQTDTKTVGVQVQSVADVVSITAGPTAAPDTVASAGAVTLAVTATDSIMGHTVSYTWTAICAGGLGSRRLRARRRRAEPDVDRARQRHRRRPRLHAHRRRQ